MRHQLLATRRPGRGDFNLVLEKEPESDSRDAQTWSLLLGEQNNDAYLSKCGVLVPGRAPQDDETVMCLAPFLHPDTRVGGRPKWGLYMKDSQLAAGAQLETTCHVWCFHAWPGRTVVLSSWTDVPGAQPADKQEISLVAKANARGSRRTRELLCVPSEEAEAAFAVEEGEGAWTLSVDAARDLHKPDQNLCVANMSGSRRNRICDGRSRSRHEVLYCMSSKRTILATQRRYFSCRVGIEELWSKLGILCRAFQSSGSC